MRKASFLALLALILVSGVSYAYADMEMSGGGFAIISHNDTSMYKSNIRISLQDPSTVSNGSLTLITPNSQMAFQFSPNWIFAYKNDGSFAGSGQVHTDQNDVYDLKLIGKKLVTVDDGSAWNVKGVLQKEGVQYSLYYLLTGKDTISQTKSSLEKYVIIPRGTSNQTEIPSFIPLHLEVFRGTTVTWLNEDSVPHTIQSTDKKGMAISLFNSGFLNTNDEYKHTFDKPGTYYYYDTLNPWRGGTVTVW